MGIKEEKFFKHWEPMEEKIKKLDERLDERKI
jgi:hypothetical protein